jgi:hypothetical protein
MSRDTRFFLIVCCAFALLVAAGQTGSGIALLVAWIGFVVAWLSQIKIADTHSRLFGPVWLRRAIYASIAVLSLAVPMVGALSA